MTYFSGYISNLCRKNSFARRSQSSYFGNERNIGPKWKEQFPRKSKISNLFQERFVLFALNLKVMLQITKIIALFARKYKNPPRDIRCLDRFWGAQNFWSPQHLKQNKIGYFLRFWGAQNFWSPQHLNLNEIGYFHRFWGAQNFWSPQHLKLNEIGYFHRFWGAQNFWSPQHFKQKKKLVIFSDSEGLRISDPPNILTRTKLVIFSDSEGAQNFWSPQH